jgi:hypothetical protein
MPFKKEELIAIDDAGIEHTIIATIPTRGTRNLDGQVMHRTLLATLQLKDGRYVARISAKEFKVLPDGIVLKLKNQPPN